MTGGPKEGRERDRTRGPEAPKEGREDRRNQGKRERERETSSVAIFAQASECIARVNKPSQRVPETVMSWTQEDMAVELGRLREKVRALEARDIELERQADTADVVISELMAEIERMTERQQSMEKSLEESQKIQDWKADQTEELWKSAAAVRQRLEYLLKKDSKFEARISQLEGEV